MKIVKLQAQNIKNLKAIEITPDGNVIQLTGKNGAGKSAILDAIYSGLTGTKIDDVVRHGETKGEVEINLGDYIIRRVYKNDNDRLEITNPAGLKYASPQTMLDKLIGKLTFDPLSFKDMKPLRQRELLMNMVGLDFTDLDKKYKEVYDSRTLVNRDIEVLKARIGGWVDNPAQETDEISLTAQTEHIQALQDKREKFLEAKTRKQEVEETIKKIQHEIEKLQMQLSKMQTEANSIVIPAEVTQETIDKEMAKISEIDNENAKRRETLSMRDKVKELKDNETLTSLKTTSLENLLIEKKNRINTAQFPIAGLGVDDENVIFNDIPLQNLSTGQQIRVSTAIAMALNPQVKIILIREGSLLDKDGLKVVFDMAQEKDYQVWVESVANEKGVGIFIEDGQIK